MRIITGSARGVRLEAPAGLETRPTAEKVKEAVFSMIQFEIEGREVLDGFGGSGQMALEALSRGAVGATVLDTRKEAVEVIRRNAQKTKLYEKCIILQSDCLRYLRTAKKSGRRFDLVFLDPPYDSTLAQDALTLLAREDLVRENGKVIVESDREEPFTCPGFTLRRHAKYGRIRVSLLEKSGDAPSAPDPDREKEREEDAAYE